VGEPDARTVYVVDDVTELYGPGRTVVRARRRAAPGARPSYEGEVALKIARDDPSRDLDAVRRLYSQVAACGSPHLARPLEVFVGPGLTTDRSATAAEHDVRYAVLVWEPGTTLTATAPCPPAVALRLLGEIAEAVRALHRTGLLHRDLHPDNVIVRPDGSGVVIDYDSVEPVPASGCVPTAARVVGLVAPECRGGGPYSTASDRWAVGMLGIFALLGFAGIASGPAQRSALLAQALAELPQAKRAHRLLLDMVVDEPHRRPSDVVAWASQLESCTARRRRRCRRIGAFAGTVALAGLGIGAQDLERSTAAPAEQRAWHAAAAVHGGVPIDIEVTDEPAVVTVRLDNGGVLVGRRADTELFWIPAQWVDAWLATGGADGSLGVPTTDLHVDGQGAVLEFEHGTMHVPLASVGAMLAGEDGDVVVEVVDRFEVTRLPPTGVLLGQWNGSAGCRPETCQ
jgi:hypothetical protein